MNPSQVFPGLRLGAIFVLPNQRPKKYAPLSTSQVAGRAVRVHPKPKGCALNVIKKLPTQPR